MSWALAAWACAATLLAPAPRLAATAANTARGSGRAEP